jgi:DNA-directed RNA polymerase specialized sigma24 family protein
MPGTGRFATTEWSLVLAAGARDSPASEEALGRLCSVYWYPIFAFIRRRGHGVDEAQDLTQSFFTRLIEKGHLADADRECGRFRTFLLTACQRFLSNEREHAQAAKRGGGHVPLSIDVAMAEERYARSLAHADTPELLYDRQWCLTLLGAVLDSLREEYASNGREQLFDRLRSCLTFEDSDTTHAEAARDLEMSVAAVKVAVHRLRRRYRDALRRRVGDTVESPADVDDEIRYLLKML